MYQNYAPGKTQPTNPQTPPNSLLPPSAPHLSPPNPPARNTHASMILPQTQSPQPFQGLGKLETMGRVIKQHNDPVNYSNEPPLIQIREAPSTQIREAPPTQGVGQMREGGQSANTLSFRGQRPKMSSSVIFPKSEEGGYQPVQTQGFGTSRLDAMVGKKGTEREGETSEEQRKREIGSIKLELDKLNKKMEHFNFKKPGEAVQSNNSNKQYFQLPTRKVSVQPEQPGPTNPHLQAFKKYSEPTSTSQNVPSGQEFLQVKPSQPNLQHSLSANDLPKREEPGNMFKKKVNQFQGAQQGSTQNTKTFLLSPRAQKPLPPKPVTPKSVGFKQAEVVDSQPSSQGRQLKRVDSTQVPAVEESSKGKEKERSVKGESFKRSDFVVGKKLGKGQFGEVMMVIHKGTGFLCAMKVMSKKQIREQKYENQVARELSIQFYLSHRNVSPLYGYFEDEENVYLLVEFATGGQLLQTLRKAHRMEEQDCSPIIREVCEGLDYVHKEQIIHRDVKPENILFNFDTVKICDFGWAVHCGTGMRKTVAGSPLYYSPEVVMETKYDEKIDLWAIGMMTYECLLGKIPFRIYSELDLNRIVEDEIKFPEYVDVSDDVKDFILKICKKDPDERMEMRDILRHPFITKYAKQKKVTPEVLQDLHQFLAQ